MTSRPVPLGSLVRVVRAGADPVALAALAREHGVPVTRNSRAEWVVRPRDIPAVLWLLEDLAAEAAKVSPS
jgi:hypothetical protein